MLYFNRGIVKVKNTGSAPTRISKAYLRGQYTQEGDEIETELADLRNALIGVGETRNGRFHMATPGKGEPIIDTSPLFAPEQDFAYCGET